MEFNKNRIYTAVNADELKIGSKCIFADTVKGLRRKVEEDADCVETFYRLHNNGSDDLFVGNKYLYYYAYLIEPPAEPKYKPFSDIEKTFEIIKKHGGWVKKKANGDLHLVSHIGKITDGMLSISCWTSETLLKNFVFADDGSPCGEFVEE
ncbi:hypothetical protein [Treponema denticola]|uniref:Uncharacterized protein n=1 Tax=Treponema denticola SP33 TaxID=999437 RepID=M2BBV7_TREDN|nr:hypothetical protein [Treponema denticola]EMB19569.1 hypothetical protein HMPREF9733_02669 [Treponema denticola SP33]EPF37994.1 hypothetical protein HMPREF9732_00088 [Treponema denticola SP32]